MAVTVTVVGSRVEADMVVGMLRSRGVKATLSADDAGGVDLALQAQGVRVLVPDGQAAKARALLEDDATGPRPMNRFQRWVVRLLGGTTPQ